MLSLRDFLTRSFWGYCTVMLWLGRALLAAAWIGVIVVAIGYQHLIVWYAPEPLPGTIPGEMMVLVFFGAPVLLWVLRKTKFLP